MASLRRVYRTTVITTICIYVNKPADYISHVSFVQIHPPATKTCIFSVNLVFFPETCRCKYLKFFDSSSKLRSFLYSLERTPSRTVSSV